MRDEWKSFHEALQDLGLTQKELAKRAGVSQQQIAKLENPDENPTIRTLSKVSEALRGHGGRVVRERGLSSIRCYIGPWYAIGAGQTFIDDPH